MASFGNIHATSTIFILIKRTLTTNQILYRKRESNCVSFFLIFKSSIGSDRMAQPGNDLSLSSNNILIGATPSHWNIDGRDRGNFPY